RAVKAVLGAALGVATARVARGLARRVERRALAVAAHAAAAFVVRRAGCIVGLALGARALEVDAGERAAVRTNGAIIVLHQALTRNARAHAGHRVAVARAATGRAVGPVACGSCWRTGGHSRVVLVSTRSEHQDGEQDDALHWNLLITSGSVQGRSCIAS